MSEHSLTMVNRSSIQMAGIKNVVTFDEQEVILETDLGYLVISGQDLHVSTLNLEEGKVSITGKANHLEYKEQGSDLKTRGKSILNRLLK
ncbi:sporulation protein YabP [Syntrophomonas palmitatica]|uniref:sporulation protein YabP n=1 Tax=Syntrophomonas palmitatica TaxID=402877 RepID=UPI0006D17805|nr:sporulation protein YabP [Syntrophomonas palmitatica]